MADAAALAGDVAGGAGWGRGRGTPAPDAGVSGGLAEVLGRLARDGASDDALAGVEARLRPLAVPFEAALTVETGRLVRVARGLSLGDRACIATAKHVGLPAVTADKVWAKLYPGVEVRLIR